jgi:hypothetical protein
MLADSEWMYFVIVAPGPAIFYRGRESATMNY